MRTSILSVAGVAAVVLIGAAVLLKSQANDWLFDEDSFASCFRSEGVSAYQTVGAMSDNDLMMVNAESLFGASLESMAHMLAKSVKRNGIDAELASAKKSGGELTTKRLEAYESTGAVPEKSADDIITETTVTCLERQVRF